jgi:succinyl-CoA synthetase beta subunit
MNIKGHIATSVMVTSAVDVAEEYYLAFLLDRASRGFLGIASVAGGMDIEQVARETPDQVAKVAIGIEQGVCASTALAIVEQAGFDATVAAQAADLAVRLWQVFVAEDATLLEINPLAKDADGRLLCLDAKVTVDDNAAFRHPEHSGYLDAEAMPALERAARAKGLNYVKLDGQVGVIGNGAGLVMSTLDAVAHAGRDHGIRPANFLDIGGGASAQVMADGLEIVLSDPDVRAVLINVFGGITACDEVARGVLRALDLIADRGETGRGERLRCPIVVRLDGNSAEAGRTILDSASNPLVTRMDTMDAAAGRAAELAGRAAELAGRSRIRREPASTVEV